jgi:hypothetical protein
VHDVAVFLDGHEVGHPDGAEIGDTTHVIACQVDEHQMLSALFRVGKERSGVGFIFLFGGAAPFRAGNRANLDATIHRADMNFRRTAHQREPVRELETKHVG